MTRLASASGSRSVKKGRVRSAGQDSACKGRRSYKGTTFSCYADSFGK